jgi:hypothetical protein
MSSAPDGSGQANQHGLLLVGHPEILATRNSGYALPTKTN